MHVLHKGDTALTVTRTAACCALAQTDLLNRPKGDVSGIASALNMPAAAAATLKSQVAESVLAASTDCADALEDPTADPSLPLLARPNSETFPQPLSTLPPHPPQSWPSSGSPATMRNLMF